MLPHHNTPPPSSQQHVALMERGTTRGCRVVEWKPWPFDNPSLIGHCAVAFSGGWIVHAIPVFRRIDGSLSVGVPNAAQLDSEGRIKQRDGKRQYLPLLSFETGEARDRWQRMVLTALADAGITTAPAPAGGAL